MVGGKVIETIVQGDLVWLKCRDLNHPRQTCAIYVERSEDAESVQVGDSLWWQGRYAYWTPASRVAEDHPLPRVGYSGNLRPGGHDVLDQDVVYAT